MDQPYRTDHPAKSPSNLERRTTLAIPFLLFAGIALKCTTPFRSNLSWMVFVQDDFFYYLRTAQNFAHGNGSTFNGITPTNGYHPLWFLILSAFSYFTSSPRLILALVALLAWVASAATYRFAFQLIASTGIRQLSAAILASWITLYSLRLFFYGMEVTLTIPLSLAILCLLQNTDFWLRGMKQCSLLGLAISLLILSRLDTVILMALIAAFACFQPHLRSRIKVTHLAGIALGLLPLAIYFYLNHHFFHVWLPISGMAKQLRLTHHPTLRAWKGLYLTKPNFLAVFLPIPLGIVLYPLAMKHLSAIQKALYPATLLFPLVYFFVLCCVSDWPIWPWYMYAQRPAVCMAFVIFCAWRPFSRIIENTAVTVALLIVMVGFAVASKWRIQEVAIYSAAVSIKEFSQTHPGTYAMGDRSGRVGYLLDQPLIQLEGLVMDKTFLGYIQRQTPLQTILDAYDVRYYIAFTGTPYIGCFQAVEPYQAGPESPHMRGEFCSKPVDIIKNEEGDTLIFDRYADKVPH
jgi:hypothetical protein